jgi:hypothetical protein
LTYIYILNLKVDKVLIIKNRKEAGINIAWNVFNSFFNNNSNKEILRSSEREGLNIIYLKF